MEIKEAIYKKEKREVRVLVSEAVYGCDECQKEITEDGNNIHKLSISVFHTNKETPDSHDFCSWKCVFKFIPKIECDHFVSLPYLHYDEDTPEITVKDFIVLTQ